MPTNFPTSVDNFTNPTANDSLNLPSHSTQHANANDAIEAIEGYIINGTGAAWQTYAPSLANGWANGNGTWTAEYTQIGKTVHARGTFTFGSTTTKSANQMRVTLPVAPSENAKVTTASLLNNAVCAGLGTTIWGRVGAGTYLEMSALNAASTYALRSNITSTIPATWTTGDSFNFTVTYEAA